MSEPHLPKVIAGEEAMLARRYASALYELASDKKVIDAVASDLGLLRDVVDSDPHFRLIARHPRLPSSEVQKVVKSIITAGKFSDVTASFLMQVVRNRRLAYLGVMIEAFLEDLALRRSEYVAAVTVAKALSKEQQDKLAAQLGKMVDGSVQLVIEEDATLIGGLVVKLGSRLIDASVSGRLARIERQLKSQQEAA